MGGAGPERLGPRTVSQGVHALVGEALHPLARRWTHASQTCCVHLTSDPQAARPEFSRWGAGHSRAVPGSIHLSPWPEAPVSGNRGHSMLVLGGPGQTGIVGRPSED